MVLFVHQTYRRTYCKEYFTKWWNTAFLLYCITQIVVQLVSHCPCHRKTWHCWQRNSLHILPHAVKDAWKPSTTTYKTLKNKWQPKRIQFIFMLFDATWQVDREKATWLHCIVCWMLCMCVCGAVSLHHLCYRVTFSRKPSVWHVATWQTNLSNMCACGTDKKNCVTWTLPRANEFICLLLL